MSTIPDGIPENGFEEFEFLGFGDAIADCVIDAEWGAKVEGDQLIIKRFAITPDEVTATDEATFILPEEPVTYDITGWVHPGNSLSLGCLLTFYDAERRVHTVRVASAYRLASPGVTALITGFVQDRAIAPEPEGSAGWPHVVWGAYDPVTRRATCAIGFTNSNVRYEGTSSAAYRWQVQHSDWRPTTTVSRGDMDLILASEEDPNVHPTGVIRFDTNEWVITVADVGPSLPAYRQEDGIEDGCVSSIIHARGLALDGVSMAGYVGRGFVERREVVEYGELTTVIDGYLPYATHGADGISRVHLLHYPDLGLVLNPDGDPHEVARIEGSGNWRPVGLFVERFQEPEIVDPLFFDPAGFTFGDYLVSLLHGWTGVQAGFVVQDRVVLGISVPDQPPYATNPRSHPCYLVMVDLRAALGVDEDEADIFGPANIGEPVRLNFGDVLRIASHPSGVSWGVVGRWDEESDVDPDVNTGTGGGFGLPDLGSWNLPEGAIL